MSDSASAPPDKVCPKCGLRIGQVGSFTYWIFNDDRCRCNAAEADDAKGQIFDRRYELLQCVGSGAMGYVYKAMDTQTQETVALKLLRRELAGNQLAIKRLMKEVAIMSGLSNTNLGQVIGYGQEQDGVPYLVM
jgi:serine/threonine protein kinase